MRKAGRDIVMLGFAGARIALTLAELHREEIQKRFPKHFLKLEEELQKVIERLSQAGVLQESQNGWPCRLPEECLVALREDEVFPALWKLAEGLDAGLDVGLRSIPISQFVIEICELLDVNPYVNITAPENKKCFSENISSEQETAIYGMLIATEVPEEWIAFAEANEIPSAIIGRLTDKNDRVVRNGEIIRYLTPEG